MTVTIHDLGLPYYSYKIYDVDFHGDVIKTLVTDKQNIITTWISDMEHLHSHRLHRLLVGLDIEWRPNFDSYLPPNPPATLQLCVGRNCLIIQLTTMDGFPQSLYDFLGNQDYTFVGVGIGDDLDKLERHHGLEVANAVDLRNLAVEEHGMGWMGYPGLKALASQVLGKEIDKPRDVTLSDWDCNWLSLDQIKYACVDAYASFEIGRCLNA